MVSTLHIKNIGIINDLTVDLNNGFNVLTGETGAGKTLIIDSLRYYIRRQIFKGNDKKRRESFFYRIKSIFAS
ncbi:MAG: AAA family ATPase [Clostridia bacterium]|nr:AAA family ATPase [Clostridia bacterium]